MWGTEYERKGLDMLGLRGVQAFWKRKTAKLAKRNQDQEKGDQDQEDWTRTAKQPVKKNSAAATEKSVKWMSHVEKMYSRCLLLI